MDINGFYKERARKWWCPLSGMLAAHMAALELRLGLKEVKRL